MSRQKSKSAKSLEQVKVILKLFVVMGVTWLSELCYFIVGWVVGKEIVWKYFAINDFINFSQGEYLKLGKFTIKSIHLKI